MYVQSLNEKIFFTVSLVKTNITLKAHFNVKKIFSVGLSVTFMGLVTDKYIKIERLVCLLSVY